MHSGIHKREKSCRFREVRDIPRVIENVPPYLEELPAADCPARRSFTPADPGTTSSMNRFDLVFPPSGQPAPAPDTDLSWSPAETDAAVATQTKTAELITVRIKPGASIRRLRNHRCAWPRKF